MTLTVGVYVRFRSPGWFPGEWQVASIGLLGPGVIEVTQGDNGHATCSENDIEPSDRLEDALRSVGSERSQDPDWQRRVWNQIAAAQPSAWRRYHIGMWIGLAIAGAVVALVALSGGMQ